jgi:hypothetical protein
MVNDTDPCRGLPFCALAAIRGTLRIPDGAGGYRGIRATTEQPSAVMGLDHHSRRCLGVRPTTSPAIASSGLGPWRDIML